MMVDRPSTDAELSTVTRQRRSKDRIAGNTLFLLSLIPVVLVILITIALVIRFWPILSEYSLIQLLSGQIWKPQQGQFGYWPFIMGTIWVSVVSVIIAIPPCLLTAIYLTEYLRSSMREKIKPVLDLLAAIPSVVYGVWGILAIVPLVGNTIAPFFRMVFKDVPFFVSKNPTGYSILSAGIVLAVMISPFVISLTMEIISTTPAGLREASLALGTTRFEMIRHVILPYNLKGIIAAVTLGTTRALGETMAVLMIVGNVVQVPKSIFDAAYPLTALIANNYGEMMSIPLYDSALLGAALILLAIIIIMNIISSLFLRHIIGKQSHEISAI
jgi:phosphate transport system permease protein